MPDMHREPAVYEVLDPRFEGIDGDHYWTGLFDDGRWLEGPAYHRAHRILLFSDIPNDRILRFDERTGRVDVFLEPAGFANGRTVDAEGRFVWCEHGGRRVVRLEHDGTLGVVADSFGGERLNSPNDVAVHPDGSVWFTDPTYGIATDYEGHASEQRQPHRGVYRVDAGNGAVEVRITDRVQPNGLCFADGGRTLLVTDSEAGELWRYGLDGGGAVASAERIAQADAGCDGIRLDAAGRIWLAAHDGVRCHAADGTLLGRIPFPETVSNLEFGGPQRNLLYITATTGLWVLRTKVTGA
jgi:gluconolactonase